MDKSRTWMDPPCKQTRIGPKEYIIAYKLLFELKEIDEETFKLRIKQVREEFSLSIEN